MRNRFLLLLTVFLVVASSSFSGFSFAGEPVVVTGSSSQHVRKPSVVHVLELEMDNSEEKRVPVSIGYDGPVKVAFNVVGEPNTKDFTFNYSVDKPYLKINKGVFPGVHYVRFVVVDLADPHIFTESAIKVTVSAASSPDPVIVVDDYTVELAAKVNTIMRIKVENQFGGQLMLDRSGDTPRGITVRRGRIVVSDSVAVNKTYSIVIRYFVIGFKPVFKRVNITVKP